MQFVFHVPDTRHATGREPGTAGGEPPIHAQLTSTVLIVVDNIGMAVDLDENRAVMAAPVVEGDLRDVAHATRRLARLELAGVDNHEAVEPKPGDRKSVVEGKSLSVRVDLGGRRVFKKKKKDKR